jgi:hypothetical protein
LHGNEFSLCNHDQCRILGYKLIHHTNDFLTAYGVCVCVCVCVKAETCTHKHTQSTRPFLWSMKLDAFSNSNSKLVFFWLQKFWLMSAFWKACPMKL